MAESHPTIGPTVVRFSFLQIKPGYARDVIQNYNRTTAGQPRGCLFCLSDFDAVVIEKMDRFPGFPWARTSTPPTNVQSRQDIVAFSWDDARRFLRSLSVPNLTAPRPEGLSCLGLGIVLIKIDSRLKVLLGIDAERAALTALDKILATCRRRGDFLGAITGTAFSTFGDSELLLVLQSRNIDDFFRVQAVVGGLHYHDSNGRIALSYDSQATEGCPVFQRAQVIVCVPLHLDEVFGKCRAFTLLSTAASMGALRASVEARARQANNGKHTAFLSPSFGNTETSVVTYSSANGVQGPNAYLSPIPVSCLVDLLLDLRATDKGIGEGCAGPVLDSNTVVFPADDSGFTIKPVRFRVTFDRPMSSPRFHKIDASETAVEGPDVVDRFYSRVESSLNNPSLSRCADLACLATLYSTGRSDPRSREALSDMDAFVSATWSLLRRASDLPATADVTHELRLRYTQLEAITEIFTIGYRQRIAGVSLTPDSGAGLWPDLHASGIQRILSAANAVPRALLSHLWRDNKTTQLATWRGFSVFGYHGEASRLENGVMSLPTVYLFDPSEWWRLGHETGHEACDLIDLLNLPEIREITRSFAGDILGNALDEHSLLKAERLVSEIFACVFEFDVAFLGNWDFYINSVWSFLNRYLAGESDIERLEQFFLRSLFVAVHHLENQGLLSRDVPLEEYERQGQRGPWILGAQALRKSIVSTKLANDNGLCGVLDSILEATIGASDPPAPDLHGWLYVIDRDNILKQQRVLDGLRPILDHWIRSSMTRMFRTASTPSWDFGQQESRMLDLVKTLSKGQVVRSPDIRPIDICLALAYARQEGKPLSMESQTAAIMSLWHLEVTGATRL